MASKERVNKSVAARVKAFAKILIDEGYAVSQVILFGSYAKGLERKDSDVDVAVISPKFGKDVMLETIALRKAAMKIDSRIEPVPLTPLALKDKYSTFSSEITAHGIPLYVA